MSVDILNDLPELQPGSVWLVGAGPGDPGLLTLHAVNALRQADVIVYDALVNAACLGLAKPGAVLEYAGKRGGKPSAKQRDISLRLVEVAREGKRVLRLKGGDPFVFGRGGEEALTLVEHRVPFRIVPGVTAGIGGLAYAGIPVTHRTVNHSVTFLTGHDSSGIVPDRIDWESVARGSPVIVMYMAMKHIATITEKLLAAGRSANEALAVVSNATTDPAAGSGDHVGCCAGGSGCRRPVTAGNRRGRRGRRAAANALLVRPERDARRRPRVGLRNN